MKMPGRQIIKLLLVAIGLSSGYTGLWGQCQKWEYLYSPEIRCDYLEYFGLPRQASQIYLARQDSKIAPGDYYQEPTPDHFLQIEKTKNDIDRFNEYLETFFKAKYVCNQPADLFNTILINSDSTFQMGRYSHQVSYPDSSRREFFGKFMIDSSLIFVSGWFDKFVCLYINVECDSVEVALDKARELLKLEVAPLNKYTKSIFETTRSDVHRQDSSTQKEAAISEKRENDFYRLIDSDKTVWYLFKKNVALISGKDPNQQQICGVKRFWVVSLIRYFDKQYLPPWLKSPQK